MEGKSWMQSTLNEVLTEIKHNSTQSEYLITQYKHPIIHFLDINHCLVFYLKTTFWRMDHLCSTHLGPTERASPYLKQR
jgi:hypothetical protein